MGNNKDLARLIELCKKWLYSSKGEDNPCREIFRYAIKERDQEAWEAIEELCRPLVYRWIRQEGPFRDSRDLEEVVQDAFFRFWRYYTLDKFRRSGSLGEVLAYLRTCVVSAVMEKKRELHRRERIEIPWSEDFGVSRGPGHVPPDDSEQDLEATAVWQIVQSHCRDRREELLARLTLVGKLKAREIARLYPDEFPSVEEVYRLRRNLFKRLRRDIRLKRMAQKRL